MNFDIFEPDKVKPLCYWRHLYTHEFIFHYHNHIYIYCTQVLKSDYINKLHVAYIPDFIADDLRNNECLVKVNWWESIAAELKKMVYNFDQDLIRTGTLDDGTISVHTHESILMPIYGNYYRERNLNIILNNQINDTTI